MPLSPRQPPPGVTSVGWRFLYGALDSHPFFPSHVASGRCVLSPLRPVLLMVSFLRARNPVIGVPGLCGLRRVPFAVCALAPPPRPPRHDVSSTH